MKIIQWFKSLYVKYFKKISINSQVSEWFKTVPNTPKPDRKKLEFICFKCKKVFEDESTQFQQIVLDNYTGEYITGTIPKEDVLCSLCYTKGCIIQIEQIEKRNSSEGIVFVSSVKDAQLAKDAIRKPTPFDLYRIKFGKDLKFISPDEVE